MSTEQVLRNVPCPGCGCVCDDLSLRVAAGQLLEISPACPLAQDWFQRHWSSDGAVVKVDGRPSSLQEAVSAAAAIMHSADYPLVYGLSRSATRGQRAAVALAETVGAIVDTTASLCHGPSIVAIQEVGEITSTLGEIRNRADLVVFWGCNPAESHPRHAERYSVTGMGKHVPGGRDDRRIVMVGDERWVGSWQVDATGTQADSIIGIPPDSDFETLASLHAALVSGDDNMLSEPLRQLLSWMKSCRYGVVFFGLGLAKTPMWRDGEATQSGHNDVAALLRLVADLNAHTRFTARRLRMQGDVSGADSVLCWQTGYPFGVDLTRGHPRYNPGEFTANELLERGDVDACLILGAETMGDLTSAAREHLNRVPTILIDYPGAKPPTFVPRVQITTAVYGIHAPGTIYRMDNVPLSIKQLIPCDLPTDEAVLASIERECIALG